MDTNPISRPDARQVNHGVAARIREVMARYRYTAAELASRMATDSGGALDPRWITRRANGEVDLTLSDLAWLAEAMEVPVGELLTDLIPDNRVTFPNS